MNFLTKLKRSTSQGLNSAGLLINTEPYIKHSLVSGSLKRVTICPKDVELSEWIAALLFDFWTHTQVFFECCGCLSGPKCDLESFTWTDTQKRKVHAAEYFEYLSVHLQRLFSDEKLFPTRQQESFPKDFLNQTARPVYRLITKLLIHLAQFHYDTVILLQSTRHVNTLIAHFYVFGKEFDLIEKKDWLPLTEFLSTF
jgi:MOB kinase activator 1